MMVLLCKIYCPFICFCKPPSHIYSPRLQLENNSHEPSKTILSVGDNGHCDGIDASDHVTCDGTEPSDVKEECSLDSKEDVHQEIEVPLKSSLRKSGSASTAFPKKKVQWVDAGGKDLVEIREFESSELEHLDYDDGEGCVCVII